MYSLLVGGLLLANNIFLDDFKNILSKKEYSVECRLGVKTKLTDRNGVYYISNSSGTYASNLIIVGYAGYEIIGPYKSDYDGILSVEKSILYITAKSNYTVYVNCIAIK